MALKIKLGCHVGGGGGGGGGGYGGGAITTQTFNCGEQRCAFVRQRALRICYDDTLTVGTEMRT